MKHETSGADLGLDSGPQFRFSPAHIDSCQRRLRRVTISVIVAVFALATFLFWRAIRPFSENPFQDEFLIFVGLPLATIGLIAGIITGLVAYRINMRRMTRMMDSVNYRFESDILVLSVLQILDFSGIPITRTFTRRYDLGQVVQVEVGDMRYPDELRARLQFANKGWLPTLQNIVIPNLENMGDFIAELEQRLPGKIIYVDETLSPWTLQVVLRKLVVVAVMITAIACAMVYGLP